MDLISFYKNIRFIVTLKRHFVKRCVIYNNEVYIIVGSELVFTKLYKCILSKKNIFSVEYLGDFVVDSNTSSFDEDNFSINSMTIRNQQYNKYSILDLISFKNFSIDSFKIYCLNFMLALRRYKVYIPKYLCNLIIYMSIFTAERIEPIYNFNLYSNTNRKIIKILKKHKIPSFGLQFNNIYINYRFNIYDTIGDDGSFSEISICKYKKNKKNKRAHIKIDSIYGVIYLFIDGNVHFDGGKNDKVSIFDLDIHYGFIDEFDSLDSQMMIVEIDKVDKIDT